MRYRYEAQPHPHIFIEEIVAPEDYERMEFPDQLVSPSQSWGITGGDPAYAEVMKDPLWRGLREELGGEPFIKGVLGHFGDAMRDEGCLVDPDAFIVSDFIESRDQKEETELGRDADPNDLFTRLDFQSKGQGGYREFVHLDWARRIVGGILFFSDAVEEGLEGGELALYRDRDYRNDRWCHDPELLIQFPPRHNTGVIFLNSNRGFHGPRAIRRLDGRRRWLYYTISSKVNVWPAEPRIE